MRARSEDVTWRNVDGQVVILDLRDSCYLRTNATGALLWERLQDECSVDDLVQALVGAYGVDEPTARHDVAEFLESVTASDLLLGSA